MEELLKGSEIDNLKEGSVIKGIITEILVNNGDDIEEDEAIFQLK